MALAGASRGGNHRRHMTPLAPCTVTAAPQRGRDVAVCAHRVALFSDDAPAATAWGQALGVEGVQAVAGERDAPADVQALLLLVTHGLADQLARLRELRRQAALLPLLVACRGLRELDQVLALEMGADDVLDADWSAPVVAARLRAQWRRAAQAGAAPTADDELAFGGLHLQLRARRVTRDARAVPLTEGEFEVLWLLASHAGSALSRREILRRVRGLDDSPTDRSIDSRVYRIRHKLGDSDPTCPCIRTVRNRGYLFSPVGW
jgi:two-component system, OmpR family, response regulator RstA